MEEAGMVTVFWDSCAVSRWKMRCRMRRQHNGKILNLDEN